MDYQNFRKEFLQSGLTQKAYSKRLGISPSMVSYYLRKAREDHQPQEDVKQGGTKIFSKLQVVSPSNRVVRITYPSGMQVDLPI